MILTAFALVMAVNTPACAYPGSRWTQWVTDLDAQDLIAIVQPVSRSLGMRSFVDSGSTMRPVLASVDRLRIVNGPNAGFRSIVDVVAPWLGHLRPDGLFFEPGTGPYTSLTESQNYLLLAKNAIGQGLPIQVNGSAGRSIPWRTLTASTDQELAGYMLVPVDTGRLAPGSSIAERYLRTLAEGVRLAANLATLEQDLMALSQFVVNGPGEKIAGQPSTDWFVHVVVPSLGAAAKRQSPHGQTLLYGFITDLNGHIGEQSLKAASGRDLLGAIAAVDRGDGTFDDFEQQLIRDAVYDPSELTAAEAIQVATSTRDSLVRAVVVGHCSLPTSEAAFEAYKHFLRDTDPKVVDSCLMTLAGFAWRSDLRAAWAEDRRLPCRRDEFVAGWKNVTLEQLKSEPASIMRG